MAKVSKKVSGAFYYMKRIKALEDELAQAHQAGATLFDDILVAASTYQETAWLAMTEEICA